MHFLKYSWRCCRRKVMQNKINRIIYLFSFSVSDRLSPLRQTSNFQSLSLMMCPRIVSKDLTIWCYNFFTFSPCILGMNFTTSLSSLYRSRIDNWKCWRDQIFQENLANVRKIAALIKLCIPCPKTFIAQVMNDLKIWYKNYLHEKH